MENTRERVERYNGKKRHLEPDMGKMDRLSELPDHITNHILSLLPTIDAVRMSLVSKRWRNMWYSLPVLEFSDSAVFGNSDSDQLCRFVSSCLKLRKNDLLNATDNVISKFKLVTRYYWSYWLDLVAKSNIKVLDLDFFRFESHYSIPPLNVLNVKSLTHVSLRGISLMGLHSASLPSLISLSLVSVKLKDQDLHNLLLGCCSLEKLLLNSCAGLLNPKVFSFSLKSLEIMSCTCRTFQVEAMNLKSFLCHGSPRDPMWLKLNLSPGFPSLISLSLVSVHLKDQDLHNLLLGCCSLEKLLLNSCEGLLNPEVSSLSLKSLEIISCTCKTFQVEAMNLQSFLCHGYPGDPMWVKLNLSPSLTSLVSLSLANVHLKDQDLHNLLLGCCSLEKLLLNSCEGLLNLEVSSFSLKFLETLSCTCKTFQVEAMNLQSFICHGYPRDPTWFKLNLSPSKTLRNLSLVFSSLKDQRLEDLISRLTCLECLTVYCFSEWKHVNICSQRLKYFTVHAYSSYVNLYDASSHEDFEIIIDAPNLRYFEFQGYPTANLSMKVPNLLEANVILITSTTSNLSWYINLLNFLSNFDCSANLCLGAYSKEALIFPNILRKICRAPLPTLKLLKVKTTGLLLDNCDLMNSLLWAAPFVETLSIVEG